MGVDDGHSIAKICKLIQTTCVSVERNNVGVTWEMGTNGNDQSKVGVVKDN